MRHGSRKCFSGGGEMQYWSLILGLKVRIWPLLCLIHRNWPPSLTIGVCFRKLEVDWLPRLPCFWSHEMGHWNFVFIFWRLNFGWQIFDSVLRSENIEFWKCLPSEASPKTQKPLSDFQNSTFSHLSPKWKFLTLESLYLTPYLVPI